MLRSNGLIRAFPDLDETAETQPHLAEDDMDRRIASLAAAMRDTNIRGGNEVTGSSYRPKGELRGNKGAKPPAWAVQSESLARIEEKMLSTFRDDTSRSHRFHLPPPHLFWSGSASSPTMVQKIQSWLRIREWCYAQALSAGQRNSLMTTYQWRVALEGRYYSIPFDHVNAKIKISTTDLAKLPPAPPDVKRRRLESQPDTSTGTHTRLASRLTVNIRFGVYGGFEPFQPEMETKWGPLTLSAVDIMSQASHNLLHEVVWELCVAHFRLQLLDLDRLVLKDVYDNADHSLGARREYLIRLIWKNGSPRPTWEDDIFCDPLTSADWSRRVKPVQRMAKLLSVWPGGTRFLDLEFDGALNGAQFGRLESDVFLFYARTFHEHYGHRPVLPITQPASMLTRTRHR